MEIVQQHIQLISWFKFIDFDVTENTFKLSNYEVNGSIICFTIWLISFMVLFIYFYLKELRHLYILMTLYLCLIFSNYLHGYVNAIV